MIMISPPPFISIIIPIYNVESYINDCVDSVLSQDYTDYEIILVDDGSPDGCPAICDEYAEKFDCIRVIHKENGGLSDARNAGILAALGKYIMFIDSDDYIAEGSLTKIAEHAEDSGSDIIFLNANSFFQDKSTAVYGELYTEQLFEGENRSEILQVLSGFPIYPVNAWQKLVRREIITGNNVFFTKGIYCEDLDWSLELLKHTKNFSCCEHVHYYYRQSRDGSIMRDTSGKMFADMLFIIKKWQTLAQSESEEHALFVRRMLAVNYHIILLPRYCALTTEEKVRYKKDVKDLAWLTKYADGMAAKLEGVFIRTFGLGLFDIAATIWKCITKRTRGAAIG